VVHTALTGWFGERADEYLVDATEGGCEQASQPAPVGAV